MTPDKNLFIKVAKKNGWHIKKISANEIKNMCDKELESLPDLYMFTRPKSPNLFDPDTNIKDYLVNFILMNLNLVS